MVLSNAEKQRRFRERLKAQARSGVTQQEIIEAARLMWERDGPHATSWEEAVQTLATSTSGIAWLHMLPEFEPDDPLVEKFGAKADLIRKVSTVVRTVKYPPDV